MGNYIIPIETNLKEYYVKEESYDGIFGKGKIIAPMKATSGKDRFYVMALEDINQGEAYSWYGAAFDELDNPVEFSDNDFGQGITNTTTVFNKWKSEEWGPQNHSDYGSEICIDMWGVIEDEINEGWFVPSKSEWEAFSVALNIDKNNYLNYGLSHHYWTSSQVSSNGAFLIDFVDGYLMGDFVHYSNCVRLSMTF